jgi:hypothetical protein
MYSHSPEYETILETHNWPRRCSEHPGARTTRGLLVIDQSVAHSAHKTIHRDTRAGDPFAHVGEKHARRVALAMAAVSDSCAYCRFEEAEGCAAELGVLYDHP